MRLVNHYPPGRDHELPCGVLDTPSAAGPYARAIEMKWMSGQADPDTVVSYEYPGCPAMHDPVEDAAGVNRALQSWIKRFGRGSTPRGGQL